jgi:hypothetical protein
MRSFFNQSKEVGKFSLFGLGVSFFLQQTRRLFDTTNGQDRFAEHTRHQHKENFFSGMHTPFMPTEEQVSFFQTHFSTHSHLLPTSLEELKKQQALKTPVYIKPLSECPVAVDDMEAGTVVIGGPPALMFAAAFVKLGSLTYINDNRQRPIAHGSAFHIETDAETEAPTTYWPAKFLFRQLIRAGFGYVSYASIEKTGEFSWRSLDWFGWFKYINQGLTGLKVAYGFQLLTLAREQQRDAILQKVVKQCQKNEKFYNILNKEMNNTLLLQGSGSIIVARNEDEVHDLKLLQKNLEKEGRALKILEKEDMKKRYGFVPQGLLFAEKTHDQVLSPDFMSKTIEYIAKNGGTTINGVLIAVYVDREQKNGVIEYNAANGQRRFLSFSKLVMSLGRQPIIEQNNSSLFNVVAARGVSMLAYAHVPVGSQLPVAIVCGSTSSHAIKLSEKAVPTWHNGKFYDSYLIRMTAGACITPNVSEEDSVNYDPTIALGLLTVVRQTFGEKCEIEPIFAYGCNRQVSRYGQTHWMRPYPNIHIQYGAGGGGLTRSADYVDSEERNRKNLTM